MILHPAHKSKSLVQGQLSFLPAPLLLLTEDLFILGAASLPLLVILVTRAYSYGVPLLHYKGGSQLYVDNQNIHLLDVVTSARVGTGLSNLLVLSLEIKVKRASLFAITHHVD